MSYLGNLQESIKNTDAINMENAALSEAKKGRVNYSKELDINAQKIQMVTEQMNAQKNTLDSVNTVSKNTRSGFMQMTKITGELSDETVELKSQDREYCIYCILLLQKNRIAVYYCLKKMRQRH